MEDLREYILDTFDPDDLVEALNLSSEEIVDAFPDKIERYRYKFIEDEDEVRDE